MVKLISITLEVLNVPIYIIQENKLISQSCFLHVNYQNADG